MPPREHQKIGVKALIENPFFMLADEMGAGKTKQVIDAAQMLYHEGTIHRVIVVAPASVLGVWFDQELGELAKHLWEGSPSKIFRYRGKIQFWNWHVISDNYLRWVITNYEFIRNKDRLQKLLFASDQKTLLVLDESSYIKNSSAAQARSSKKLRGRCGRVVLLNGTPISHSPMDMLSQGNVMSEKILECNTKTHFKSRYAKMAPVLSRKGNPLKSPRGFAIQKISEWRNLEDLQARFAPYVLRRLKIDCLDLPPKLDPVTLEVALTKETWSKYQEMKKELIAWLSQETVATASQAGVKVIRLAQLCAGFIGGVENWDENGPRDIGPQEVSHEKLEFIKEWIRNRYDEDPSEKLLIWCRFRPELERLYNHLAGEPQFREIKIGKLWGSQKSDEHNESLRLLHPDGGIEGPAILIGTPATGAFGLNLAGAHTVMYTSNDVKLAIRLQSMDRVHRPGQKYPVSYFDVIATGPHGEKTIEHAIAVALRRKEDLANWTCSAWIKALEEE
jgi:SNF2 family DNA or RNA helicase